MPTLETKLQPMKDTLVWLRTLPEDPDITDLENALQTFVVSVEPILARLIPA